MKSFNEFNEGPNDPAIFKAIFLAGTLTKQFANDKLFISELSWFLKIFTYFLLFLVKKLPL